MEIAKGGKIRTPKPKKTYQRNKKKPKSEAMPGEVWAVNTIRVAGHPGLISKILPDGRMLCFISTHSEETRNKTNYPLRKNFDSNDARQSFLLKKPETVKRKSLGTFYPDLHLRDNIDKAYVRNALRKIKRSQDSE